MTGRDRFKDQRGVVIHGKAYSREQIFGVKVKCYIVLKKAEYPPHTLEKYDSVKSPNANLILLKNVIVNPSGKHSLDIISNGKVMHHFSFKSDTVASDWIKYLRECLSFESDLQHNGGESCGFDVSLLPSAPLPFSGRCLLKISSVNISLYKNDNQCIVSWPLKYIRSYGIDKNKFTLNAGHATTTGRAEFIFEVSKPWKPFHVYYEVAAKISSVRPCCSVGHVYEDRLPSISGSTRSSNSNSQNGGIYEELPEVVDCEEPQTCFEVPLNFGMTLQLPCRSFMSIHGLEECIRLLDLLLKTRQSSGKNRLMLYGAPHCGKWTLANAFATELQARILCLQCQTLSTSLSNDALGVLSETFNRILTMKQCIFFLNDIDVVPKGFQNSEVGCKVLRTLTNFLNRASSNRELIVICSTAFPWDVDESLQSLLDEQVYVPLPPTSVRLQIIRSYFQKSTLSSAETVFETVADGTFGFTVTELTVLCSELECADDDSKLLQMDGADGYERLEEMLERRVSEIKSCDSWQKNIAASASYYAAQNASQGIFFVMLESNSVLPNVSSCFLVVTPSGLELRDLDPSHVIILWTCRSIRGFGTDKNTFYLETGSANATKRGFFTFRTSEGTKIHRLIQTRCDKR